MTFFPRTIPSRIELIIFGLSRIPTVMRHKSTILFSGKKWRNSIHDSRAYSSFATLSSDHHIVSSKVKLSLRSSKPSKPHPLKLIDWKEVSTNSEVCSHLESRSLTISLLFSTKNRPKIKLSLCILVLKIPPKNLLQNNFQENRSELNQI